MTTHVLNSATMPVAGTYDIKAIPAQVFFSEIKHAIKFGQPIRSWIGYDQNAKIIQKHTGWRTPINRECTELAHGDRLLIMRLSYRQENGYKGMAVQEKDFEYFEGFYLSYFPIPSWNDLMSMDIHEPKGMRYLENIFWLKGGDLEALRSARKAMQECEDGDLREWSENQSNYLDCLRAIIDPQGLAREVARREPIKSE